MMCILLLFVYKILDYSYIQFESMISKTGRSLFFEAKHNDQHLKYDEYDIDTTSRDRNYSDINA